MNEVNEPDENGKISNLLNPDVMRKNKPFDESCKTGQTSRTKMAFYSLQKKKISFFDFKSQN
ncbi:hypothetical protein HanPSC8_Chr13g0558711 [Helianthus annuus]|nr:hypothetical protein HanPSC8_Chr13g0558711 [Helianthus annuus]